VKTGSESTMTSSSSYDVQLQIRRAAEERNAAHQDLASWIENIAIQGGKVKDPETTKTRGSTSLNDVRISSIDHSQCDDERLKGNAYFAKGLYHEAIACYTRCLGNEKSLASPVVYSNRGKSSSSRLSERGITRKLTVSISSRAFQLWHT
jgi:hypothetical protein